MRLAIYGLVKTRQADAGVQVGYALDLRQEFLSLYPNRVRHIYKEPGDPKWKTSKGPLFTGMIDAAISAGCSTYYGAFFGKQTHFAVLDIDEDSQYHNACALDKLLSELASVGLAAAMYQSSDSGGWHLYLPFIEAAQSDEVEATLKRWLRALGYELKGGQLEVFPAGNALRLPLQPGFAWLDQEGNLIQTREELDLDQALALFLQDQEDKAQDWTEAKSLIESQVCLIEQVCDRAAGSAGDGHEDRLEISGFEHLFSAGRIKKVWEEGRKFWQDGLAKPGDRHNAVLAVGHYLWYGDEERGVQALAGGRYDQYRAALIEEWLQQKHNGMCRHINEGNWRIVQEQVARAVIWRKTKEQEREPYPLTSRLLKRLVAIYKRTGHIWAIAQFERANEKSKLEARDRIRQAILELKKEGQLITLAEVARRAGAHWRTVKKNADLLVLVRPVEEKDLETQTDFDLLARSAIVPNQGGLSSVSCLGDGASDLNTVSSPELLASDLQFGKELEKPLALLSVPLLPDQEQSLTLFVHPDQDDGERLTASELEKALASNLLILTPRSSSSPGRLAEASISSLGLLAPVILGNFSLIGAWSKPTSASERIRKLIYRVLADTGGKI